MQIDAINSTKRVDKRAREDERERIRISEEEADDECPGDVCCGGCYWSSIEHRLEKIK